VSSHQIASDRRLAQFSVQLRRRFGQQALIECCAFDLKPAEKRDPRDAGPFEKSGTNQIED
jgi:hypothetical protein